MTKIKVGDRVRVCTEIHGVSQYGDTGTVDSAEAFGEFRYGVKFDAGCHSDHNCYREGELELVHSPLKTGDRVQHATNGKTGTIHGIQESATVKWDNGPIMLSPVSELLPAPAKPEKTRGQIIQELRKAAGLPEFMVGDVVKHKKVTECEEGDIVEIVDSSAKIVWRYPYTFGTCTDPFSTIELITPAAVQIPSTEQTKFKLGDYVRAGEFERIGRIDDVDDDSLLPYLVTWLDEDDGEWFSESELDKWEPRHGERVELTEDFDEAKKGMVGLVYDTGEFGIFNGEDVDVIFDNFDIGHDGEALDGGTNHYYVPANLLVPTVKVAAPKAPQFKRGDIVEIIDDSCLACEIEGDKIAIIDGEPDLDGHYGIFVNTSDGPKPQCAAPHRLKLAA